MGIYLNPGNDSFEMAVNTNTFENDMTNFRFKDDVLTLLIHLGYLAYDYRSKEVYIPNEEVKAAFYQAVSITEWSYKQEA